MKKACHGHCSGHHPRGAAGSVTGWVFAHRPSNRQRNRWAVSLLDIRPADQVLEIGFGPASRSRNWPAPAQATSTPSTIRP
jgi:hypothetical protein